MANVSSSNGLEKRPKLRFPGFDGEWKKSEFREFATVNPKCQSIPNKFYYIDLGSVEDGELCSVRVEEAYSAPSRAQRLLSQNDILFQTVRPYQQNNFLFSSENDLPTVASTGYAVFRTQRDVQYLYALIHTEHFLSSVLSRCTGTSFPAVSASDIEDIIVWTPNIDEQQKIGKLFRLLNTKIAKQKTLVEALKKYKRGVVRSLLSPENCKLKNAQWNRDTIGNLGSFIKGAPLSKADISKTGTPFILYGELYTTYHEVITSVVRKTEAEVDSVYRSIVGDVLIPTSGETPEEISTASCVMLPGVILAGDLNIFRSSKVDGRIMSYILNHIVNGSIARVAQGKSIVHVQASEISKIEISYPDPETQDRIVRVLEAISSRVEYCERELDDLTKLRSSLLQQLFI